MAVRPTRRRARVHRSTVFPGNGEDEFLIALDNLVRPDDVVLDLGCGHGELTIAIAANVASAIGVDRDPDYLALARELVEERGADTVSFLDYACTPDSTLPLPDGSVTLVVNRRGPTADKWLREVSRVARAGTPVLVLHPAGAPPAPPWLDELPSPLRSRFGSVPVAEVISWIEAH